MAKRNHDGFENRSIVGILLSPFHAVRDSISDSLSADKGYSDGESSTVVKVLQFPLKLVWGFLVFMVQAWTTSRNGLAFLRGFPAFAILAGTPIMIWGFINYQNAISLGPTSGYRKMHLSNESYDYAAMFAKKMVELKPESKQFKFYLANDLSRAGDPETEPVTRAANEDEARRIMSFIAGSTEVSDVNHDVAATLPGNFNGGDETPEGTDEEKQDEEREPEKFSDAHVWLAQKLLRKQKIEGYEEARNEKAMEHLRAAIATDVGNIRAQTTLIDLYSTKATSFEPETEGYIENLQLARESLEKLTGYNYFTRVEQVMAMPQLVDTCVKLGDRQGAQRELNNASEKISRVAQLNPDIYEVWLALVQSAVALEDYDRANDFIKTGYQNVKSQESRRKIMQLASLVHMKNADDFKDLNDPTQFQNRLFALCKAIATNPKDVNIYDRLVDYIDVEVDSPERDVWLRNSILDCPIPGVVHILIGTRELLRGDVAAGKTSWDIARHQFGTTEFVTHRLLSVAIRKRPEFGEGDLLNTALLLFPSQYMLYETRGALAKQNGNCKEAIADFETVLDKVPDLITAHKHLKDCFKELGSVEKSEYHAGKVEELLDRVDLADRERYETILNQL